MCVCVCVKYLRYERKLEKPENIKFKVKGIDLIFKIQTKMSFIKMTVMTIVMYTIFCLLTCLVSTFRKTFYRAIKYSQPYLIICKTFHGELL